MKSKNCHAFKHNIHQKNCMVSSIPGMCDFKSVHGGKKELFHFLWLCMLKCCLKLMFFKVSSPVNSLFMTNFIEWIFPQDGQILVDGFRNQNFGICDIFGWVIAFLMKMKSQITLNAVKEGNKSAYFRVKLKRIKFGL